MFHNSFVQMVGFNNLKPCAHDLRSNRGTEIVFNWKSTLGVMRQCTWDPNSYWISLAGTGVSHYLCLFYPQHFTSTQLAIQSAHVTLCRFYLLLLNRYQRGMVEVRRHPILSCALKLRYVSMK